MLGKRGTRGSLAGFADWDLQGQLGREHLSCRGCGPAQRPYSIPKPGYLLQAGILQTACLGSTQKPSHRSSLAGTVILFPSPHSPRVHCHHPPWVQSCSQVTRSPQPQSPYCTYPDAISRAGPAHTVRQHQSSGGLRLWDETGPFSLTHSGFEDVTGRVKTTASLLLSGVFGELFSYSSSPVQWPLHSQQSGCRSQHSHTHLSAPPELLAGGELVVPTADLCFEERRN